MSGPDPSAPQRRCCSATMRELHIRDDAISIFICDLCHARIWIVDGHEVSAELAVEVARWLDDPLTARYDRPDHLRRSS